MQLKNLNPIERAEAVKLVFKEHGGVLDTVIVSMYLELCDRYATLEARIVALEARKK
jgi:hypothetical protein